MTFASAYRSKIPDPDGRFSYSAEERAVWADLARAQAAGLEPRAWPPFLAGVEALGLAPDAVPQVADVSARLFDATGFRAQPVPAMIDAARFFGLLRDRSFPVATFLRRRDEIEYVREPDLFHEVYGHCPLLTDPDYAHLVQRFGEVAFEIPVRHWERLQRLFWFTIEFGLIDTRDGVRLLGAGLLSSPKESRSALTGRTADLIPFDLRTVLETDYRIDVLQPRYFVVDGIAQIRDALRLSRLERALREAEAREQQSGSTRVRAPARVA